MAIDKGIASQPKPIKHHIQVASLVAVNQELKAQIQHLKDEFLNHNNSHIENEPDLFIQQAEKKIKQLEAEAAQLKAQNRDLQQRLCDQAKELESCYEEVQHTNRELCQALDSNQVSCSEAIASAKKILRDDQPSREALARLLQVIYGQDVRARDLGRLRRWTSPKPHSSYLANAYPLSKQASAAQQQRDQAKTQSLRLKAQSQALRHQSSTLIARSQVLETQYHGLKARYLQFKVAEGDRAN